MQVRLKQPHRGMPVGTVWVPPWDSIGRDMIEKGLAEPLEGAPDDPRETVAKVAAASHKPAATKAVPKPKGAKKRK